MVKKGLRSLTDLKHGQAWMCLDDPGVMLSFDLQKDRVKKWTPRLGKRRMSFERAVIGVLR